MPHADGGCLGWARQWWRALAAELLGTALLVMLGVGSLLDVGGRPGERTLTHPALGFGFLVTALVTALGGVSGAHLNPAVTLAAALRRLLPPAAAAAYALAQLLGAALGFGALLALLPAHALPPAAGVTLPSNGVSAPAAACVEAALTGLLVLAVCGVWAEHDAARPDRSAPVKLGLTVAGLVYAGGPMTGASLNPARSLGPALWQQLWTDHWVYWVGPLAGAALATLLRGFALSAPRPPAAPEELPLRDKRDH